MSEVFAEMLWFWFNCFDGYLNPRWPTGWKQLAQAAHISQPILCRGGSDWKKVFFAEEVTEIRAKWYKYREKS